MRHPALTRFLAAFLAVMGAITLLSGGLCVKKAADDREKQNTELSLLSEKWTEAAALRAELDELAGEYEGLDESFDERSWQHAKDMLAYRKDLAMYTATEAGLKQGSEQIEEGYKGLRMGWIQHDNGLKALEEGEAQFLPGYQQYLDGKAQLEQGREQLRQAEELKAKLPDLALLRAGLEAVKASSGELSSSISAIRAILQDPPRDPETGEIDDAALRARLQGQLAVLTAQLAVVRQAMAASYGAEELEAALQPAAAALEQLSAELASGSLSGEELIAYVSGLIGPAEALPASLDAAIASADETLTMLEHLDEMKARLDAAQAALDESEPMLLAAKEKIEEGKRQLENLKYMLIYTESELIKGKKALEEKQAEQQETREDLDRRKEALEREQAELEALKLRVEEYAARKDRFGNLRYALLADEGVAARVRAGGELLPAAEEEIGARRLASSREYAFRLAAAILMLCSSLAAFFAVGAAFRSRVGLRLHLPASLALASAAAAEGISLYAGRGLIYTVLFVGVFAAGVILANLGKAKA